MAFGLGPGLDDGAAGMQTAPILVAVTIVDNVS